MKKSLLFALAIVFSNLSAHADLGSDFDALGNNDKIINRAKTLNSNRTVRVVQNRIVDRNLRLEVGGSYSGIAGGDSYVNTNAFGAYGDFHITPQWSVGVRYNKYNNQLTSEGDRALSEAVASSQNGQKYQIPTIDYQKQSLAGTVSWYPIYGKLNLFDKAVTQFDFYLTAGYGQMQLSSGNSPLMTAGGGVGFWLMQHLSARFEARWQGYNDQQLNVSRRVDSLIAGLSVGFLF